MQVKELEKNLTAKSESMRTSDGSAERYGYLPVRTRSKNSNQKVFLAIIMTSSGNIIFLQMKTCKSLLKRNALFFGSIDEQRKRHKGLPKGGYRISKRLLELALTGNVVISKFVQLQQSLTISCAVVAWELLEVSCLKPLMVSMHSTHDTRPWLFENLN